MNKQELINAFHYGKTIEIFYDDKWNKWLGKDAPAFSSPIECYRIKPTEKELHIMNRKEELAKAFKDGKTIEVKFGCDWEEWTSCETPTFSSPIDHYRIKSERDTYPGGNPELMSKYLLGIPIQFQDNNQNWINVVPYTEPEDIYRVSNTEYLHRIKPKDPIVTIRKVVVHPATTLMGSQGNKNLELVFHDNTLVKATVL
jgi:hypothetical protein